jgi:hypothetical protein
MANNESPSATPGTRVVLHTRTVGQYFGTLGQVVRVDDGEVLAEGEVRSYGHTRAAIGDAERLAEDLGCVVVDEDDDEDEDE